MKKSLIITMLFNSKSLNKIALFTLLLNIAVYANTCASSGFTGIRNITSLELTADMGAGWNLGNTLDANPGAENSWGNPITTKAMIDEIRKKGFKTIRIPVTWYSHLGAAPDYTIDPIWLARVEAVANYAFDNDMYVILNMHHEDFESNKAGSWLAPTYAKQTAVTEQLTKMWTQIATRFIAYGDYLIFETMNEPRLVGSPEEWSGGTSEGRDVVNKYNLAAVNAIRNTGGNNAQRHIMIPTYAANGSTTTINALVIPNNDSRVIVSIHAYSPYPFALQVPGISTWGSAADKAALDAEFDRLYNKFIKNGRAVVIGEWGAVDKTNTATRAAHAEYYVKAAKARQMPTVWWDNGDLQKNGFAIINRNTLTWNYSSVADAIISSSLVTGIDSDILNLSFVAYPNPVKDRLNINLSSRLFTQVGLYSIEGGQIMVLNTKASQMEIDMTKFNTGIYILKVVSSGQNVTRKIIKQ